MTIKVTKIIKFSAIFGLTFTTIPSVIRTKYITNSDGFFTGVLNLTIDSAPTIPSDRAILFEITDVIKNPVIGNSEKIKNCE